MFGSQEQTGGSVDSRFGFWRFGRFGIFMFNPTLVRVLVYGISEVTTKYRLILACFVSHLSHKILLEFGNISPQNISSFFSSALFVVSHYTNNTHFKLKKRIIIHTFASNFL